MKPPASRKSGKAYSATLNNRLLRRCGAGIELGSSEIA
jgi:hypothetical protein